MNAVDVAKLSETVTVIIQRLPITFCQICQVFGLTYCISKFSVHLHFTFLQHSSDLSKKIRKFCFNHQHKESSIFFIHTLVTHLPMPIARVFFWVRLTSKTRPTGSQTANVTTLI